ncbi:hypothetical protein JKP88DRAFT_272374 [Tribonema minus]|uniref:Uncharacterized protein n=1 Tax=Tribonema minus TaxID=303371 RepID=A0A835ZQ97_9STRA|nr:hypothetical protein JKP88DRAFT_272374 [Tribonema minus]
MWRRAVRVARQIVTRRFSDRGGNSSNDSRNRNGGAGGTRARDPNVEREASAARQRGMGQVESAAALAVLSESNSLKFEDLQDKLDQFHADRYYLDLSSDNGRGANSSSHNGSDDNSSAGGGGSQGNAPSTTATPDSVKVAVGASVLASSFHIERDPNSLYLGPRGSEYGGHSHGDVSSGDCGGAEGCSIM